MGDYIIEHVEGLTGDDEKIYFISSDIYAILVCDCYSNQINILAEFPKEVQIPKAFEKILKYEKKIYLFPCYAKDIYYFDLEKNKFIKLDVILPLIDEMPQRKVLEVLIHNKKIYCVCRCPNMVISINSDTDNVEVFKMPLELLKKKKFAAETWFSTVIRKDKLVYPYGNSAIVKFSLIDKVFDIVYFDEKLTEECENVSNWILGICIDNNDDFWMYSVCGEIYKVVKDKKIRIVAPKGPIGIFYDGNHEQPGINNVFSVGDDICFVLRSESKILKYNITTGRFVWCQNDLGKWDVGGTPIAFFKCTQVDEETFWLYNRNDNAAYKWNYRKGFIERVDFKISIDKLLKTEFDNRYRYLILNTIKKENDLYNYILYIEGEKNERKTEKNVSYGQKIYHELR